MAAGFQAPKGTRDFLPEDLAQRQWIEGRWRTVSTNHGFEEIDGPTFEHLSLYTTKSGDGIVSELFSFRRSGGDDDYALRPELTPTVARLAADAVRQRPMPLRWFGIGPFFRGERPQRGRLREFLQWNADVIGDPSMNAELDLLGLLAGTLERFGLRPGDVTIRLSHRDAAASVLQGLGVNEDQLHEAFTLLDRKEKMPAEVFATKAQPLGLGPDEISKLDAVLSSSGTTDALVKTMTALGLQTEGLAPLFDLASPLRDAGLEDWVTFDPGIVRGLAYYTGTVFEVHECRGAERAIAGGGRYDELIELLGGPKTPACGFAMGDVVLGLVLENLDRLPEGAAILPRPDCFVIDAGGRPDAARQLLRALRGAGLHARTSVKTTRNVGKLLAEASKNRARFAAILSEEGLSGPIELKDLESGEQRAVASGELAAVLATATARPSS